MNDEVRVGMKRGFSLIEMLVVIGIIVTLMGASVGVYSHMTKRAQQARGRELVSNVATALNVLFQKKGKWPTALMSEANGGEGRLRARPAFCLAKANLLSLTMSEDKTSLSGLDRFGIVTPWAQAVIKRAGTSGGGTGLRVPSGGTVEDHILYYALDTTGEGIVKANVGGVALKIRANAAVWCAGMDGVLTPYPFSSSGGSGAKGQSSASKSKSRMGDDIYSWAPNQVER